MVEPLPAHYRTNIRRLVRFAVVFLFLGLMIGVVSVQAQKSFRYGPTARQLDQATRDAEHTQALVDLPAGMMWEVSMDLRLSHGHVVLIGAVIPLCLAAALVMTRMGGGSEISKGTLDAAYWLYVTGGAMAMSLIFYKGLFLVSAVRGGEFDLREVYAEMFGASRAIKGMAYGLSHSVLAVAVGIYCVVLWRSAGAIVSSPAASA